MILYTHNWRPQKQKYLTYENLDLSLLRNLNKLDSPLDKDYNYHEAFKNLDVDALRKDIAQMLTTSQEWWPADYGNYGPFFIRYSWHAAGTYRVFDGRGGNNRGQQRFSPVGSWPDNANIDKGKQLLWPIKQKYGNAVSWSDLIALVGNVALDIMGLKTIGFAFGRLDDWQGDNTIWGYDYVQMSSNVKNGQLQAPFSSTQMGLIYVNPEGPDGKPDRVGAVKNIRDTFSGMGMNDRETVVLIAGGHTFGKTHGAGPKNHVGPAPDKALLEQQGKGWASSFRTGKGSDTITSGPQVIWTSTPTKWSHDYLKNLYELQWKKSLSPAQAHQWSPTNVKEQRMVPDPFNPGLKRLPQMLTTDLALKQDQSYNNNATDFYKDPVAFAKQFAEAWFKLMHRDMGPKSRYMGPLAPQQDFIWQDPVPEPKGQQIGQNQIKQIKQLIKNSGLTNKEMIRTAWASASTYRKTDYRGGANGARIALLPQCQWQINEPQKLAKVLQCYKKIQSQFNKSHQSPQLSLADLIILAGNLSIQSSSTDIPLQIPFTPGRTDASQAQTDIQSFNYLKCKSDGFINYHDGTHADSFLPQALVQKASMLNLNVPQMTVLFAGLRALGVVHGDGKDGILTKSVGKLDNQFFVNLLDNSTEWKKIGENKYSGVDRKTGEERWTASSFDLIFGYNPELKAVSQHYAERTSLPKFVKDFGNAWNKVMLLGRFDVVKL